VILTDVSEVIGWALTIRSLAVAYLVIRADAQAWLESRRTD
jgi:hypothetical protein